MARRARIAPRIGSRRAQLGRVTATHGHTGRQGRIQGHTTARAASCLAVRPLATRRPARGDARRGSYAARALSPPGRPGAYSIGGARGPRAPPSDSGGRWVVPSTQRTRREFNWCVEILDGDRPGFGRGRDTDAATTDAHLAPPHQQCWCPSPDRSIDRCRCKLRAP
jgi:hypothetical protein